MWWDAAPILELCLCFLFPFAYRAGLADGGGGSTWVGMDGQSLVDELRDGLTLVGWK
jgi:hypothetical protein